MELYFIIGLLSGFLTLFINYCIGSPASEKFSPYEIFSSYTVWLSKTRLKRTGLLFTYLEQYKENYNRITTKSERINLENDFKKILYEAAEPFFTWERAAGMCPVCNGVWVAFLSWSVSLLYSPALNWTNLLHLAIIVLVSHITIRLLNKIL